MDKRKTSKKKTMLEKKKPQGNAQLLRDRNIHASSILYIYIFSFLHQKADPSNCPKVYTCTLKSALHVSLQ